MFGILVVNYYCFTLSKYAPFSVSILILLPSFINKRTLMLAPVSVVDGLKVLVAVFALHLVQCVKLPILYVKEEFLIMAFPNLHEIRPLHFHLLLKIVHAQ